MNAYEQRDADDLFSRGFRRRLRTLRGRQIDEILLEGALIRDRLIQDASERLRLSSSSANTFAVEVRTKSA
jgi:hypothetical protein